MSGGRTGSAAVDGTALQYEVSGVVGEARPGGAPPVVWGHGLTGSVAAERAYELVHWDRIAAGGRTVVRYDVRGHGRSGSTEDPGSYAWSALARDQLALADHLGIHRYVAAGASMGCGTALHAAVVAPDRVVALVLVIPPTAWETRAARVQIWGQMADVVEQQGVEALVDAMMALPPPDPLTDVEAYHAGSAANLLASDRVRLAGVLRGAGTADLPARDAVAAIGVPALVLAWTGDPGHPVTTAEELHRLLPDSTLHLASTRADLEGWTALVEDFLLAR